MSSPTRAGTACRRLAALVAAPVLLVSFLGVTAGSASAAVAASTLQATNVRTSPSGSVVAVLPAGASVVLDCFDEGPRANGSNPFWYRLATPYGGNYVYAGLVNTPVDPSPNTGRCGATAAPVAAPVAATTSVSTYQVQWTGGIGVRLRNSANLADIRQPVTVLSEGESFGLQCQQVGTPVGSRNNTTWDRIAARGLVAWIPDAYTNTANAASTFTPGTPQCGAPAVTPIQGSSPCLQGNCGPVVLTPVPSSTYQVKWTGGSGVRLRGSANLADVRQPVTVLAEGESFGLQCQQAGTPVGSRGNTTWDRIAARGLVAWIPDAYTNTPNAASTFTPGVARCAPVPVPAPSSGQKVGERAVDVAGRYVTSDAHIWGGNACIDAHLGARGYVGGYSGGQCRQFMNCIVYMASNNRINPGGANYAFPGAATVPVSQARRGDIIQVGQGIHTAIVVRPLGGGSFEVIDSNWGLTERVSQHMYTPPASALFWRYSQAA